MRRAPNCSIRCTSWVATTTVTPTSLKRLNSFMISSARSRIEIAGGLVGNEQRRLGHDRARDSHALLLAGGELERPALLLAEQADLIERRAHALVDLAPRHAGDDERQRHVVRHRPVVQQLVILKDHAELAGEIAGCRAA